MHRSALAPLLMAVTACASGTVGDDTATRARPTSSSEAGVVTTPTPATTPPPLSTTTVTTAKASTTSTTVAASTSTTTTTPPPPTRLSFAFVGDILPHSPLWRRAERNAVEAGSDGAGSGHDFSPMFAEVAPLLSEADVAICHLETPIAPHGEEYTTHPRYGVPEGIVDAIATAGFDRCSTASNHTADKGGAGIDRTVDALEQRGIEQAGMARTPDEIEPAVFVVDDVAVSHLSYTWSYNGLSLPNGEEWRSALIDPIRIVSDAETARDLGADIVIVSLHWGAEGQHAVTRYQREIAEAITASGNVDLVVGHHAHVVQPIELVNDTWVMFGLGNILSNLPTSSNFPDASQDAVVATVEFVIEHHDDDSSTIDVERPVVTPTWVDKEQGWIIRIVPEQLADQDLSAGRRGRYERSLDRTAGVLVDHLDDASRDYLSQESQ